MGVLDLTLCRSFDPSALEVAIPHGGLARGSLAICRQEMHAWSALDIEYQKTRKKCVFQYTCNRFWTWSVEKS